MRENDRSGSSWINSTETTTLMETNKKEIDLKDKQLPVNIHIDEGGTATINFDITNCYNTYTYPEWMDRDLFDAILKAIGREKG